MSLTATLPTFVLASLVLAVTPGPGVVYVVTRTLAQGRAAGLASVAGVACGNICNAAGAALGLAALFAVSDAAFQVVKWAGAVWLVALGVRMLWQAAQDRLRSAVGATAPQPLERLSRGRLWRDGFLVALLNPKTTLFFAAFLPQFMNPAAPALGQALALSAVFVAFAACTDAVYVLLAATFARHTIRPGAVAAMQVGRFTGGAVLIALGLLSALALSPVAPRRPA